MRILYICGDFLISPVHKSLVTELDALGIQTVVFVPVNHNTKGAKRVTIDFKTEGSEIIYSPSLHLYHRVMYSHKISKIVKYVENAVDLSKIDLIHASLLCNEGAVAYELSKKYGIKFVSAIRNTDLNDYFRIFKLKIPYFKEIAKAADGLICISNLYSKRIESYFSSELYQSFLPKLHVISNGLHNLYLDNRHYKTTCGNPIKIVFAGGYQRNKNILGDYEAIKLLRERGFNIEFTAIGNHLQNHYEPNYAKKIEKVSVVSPWFHVMDAQPKEELIMSLREYDIFVMVSHTETFGLSYIEALSQGLPLVYTEGEGFDCMYEEGRVGYHAKSRDASDIAHSIEHVIQQYEVIAQNIKNVDLSVYKWHSIGKKYADLYKEVLMK